MRCSSQLPPHRRFAASKVCAKRVSASPATQAGQAAWGTLSAATKPSRPTRPLDCGRRGPMAPTVCVEEAGVAADAGERQGFPEARRSAVNRQRHRAPRLARR